MKKLAIIIVLVCFCLGLVSTAKAQSGVYLRFAAPQLNLKVGDQPKIVVQYGNTTNAPIHVQWLVCNFSDQYGDFGPIYKGYFKDSYTAPGSFTMAVFYVDHTLAPYQSTSVSFVLDTTKAHYFPYPIDGVFCYLQLDSGEQIRTTLPVVGWTMPTPVAPV